MAYPTSAATFTTKNAAETIQPAHVNDLQTEIAALEAAMLTTGLAHDLKFVDATYDIGKSGSTRPRDLFLSRNATIGGTLALTGVGTFTAQAAFNGGATFAGHLIATDATYDIGASGATRFRDLFLSRNAVIGGTLGVTGLTTVAALTATGNVDFAGFDLTASNGAATFTSSLAYATTYGWQFDNTHATDPGGIRVRYTAAAPNDTDNDFFVASDTGGGRFIVRSNGGIANYSANDVNLSDAEVKDIAGPAEDEWERFKQLRLVRARYKDAPTAPLDVMVTAQNVSAVYPELRAMFGPHLGVREHGLVMRAMKVIQELQARVEQLEAA